ncbi:MAG: TIGR00341 family protein [Vampirovibrio sp.]|nr:TIGR00341 family protein [Vampirovibrio sp.]
MIHFFDNFQQQNNDFKELYTTINQESSLTVDFFVLCTLSAAIASLGLLINSVAIIIGAMILAPLMSPILGISFSGLFSRRSLLVRSFFTLMIGIIIACSVSALVALVFKGVGVTPEILARTKPTIMDLMVALAAGFLGGYVKIRKSLSASVSGVAIAISLMPPLCVTGIGLTLGLPNIFIGSALLFVVNLVAIVFSGFLAFSLVDIQYFKKNGKTLLSPIVVGLLLVIPLVFNFQAMIKESRLKREVALFFKNDTLTFRDTTISKITVDVFAKPTLVTVTVDTTTSTISEKQVHLVKEYLSKKVGSSINLIVNLNPVIQVVDLDDNPILFTIPSFMTE